MLNGASTKALIDLIGDKLCDSSAIRSSRMLCLFREICKGTLVAIIIQYAAGAFVTMMHRQQCDCNAMHSLSHRRWNVFESCRTKK